MTTMCRKIRALAVALIVGFVLAGAVPAFAAEVHLKDGKVLKGKIEKEDKEKGYLIFLVQVGTVEQRKVISMHDVETIVRDEEVAPTDGKPGDAAPTPSLPPVHSSAPIISDGAAKVAFITMGDPPDDMVGPYMNTDALKESIKILDALPTEQRPDVVVLWVDSGGGALSELLLLTEYIHKELKPKYRTVAWIRAAISAAAMTAWSTEEIYMMSEGNIGGATGYSMQGGRAKQMDGRGLQEILEFMERVSSWGKHEPMVMRAMQVAGIKRDNKPLTADIDADGNVTWYLGPEGKNMVCPGDEILTLNAIDAVKYRVARGIADTKEELAKAMGLTEWVEVGQDADKFQVTFRGNVRKAETQLDEYNAKMQIALNIANGSAGDERERQVGIALRYLRQMKTLIDKAPPLKLFRGQDDEWFREVEKEIRKLIERRR